MFAQLPGDKFDLISVKLTQSNGKTIYTLSNNIYPIEVFRTWPLQHKALIESSDKQRQKFLKMVLRHINEKPWFGLDVILPSPAPETNQRFTKIEVFSETYDYRKFKNIQSFRPIKTKRLAGHPE